MLITTAPDGSVLVTATRVVVSVLTGEEAGISCGVMSRSFLIAFTQRFKYTCRLVLRSYKACSSSIAWMANKHI